MHRLCGPRPEESIKEVFDRFWGAFGAPGEVSFLGEADDSPITGQGISIPSGNANLKHFGPEDSEAHDTEPEKTRKGRNQHGHAPRGRCDEVKHIFMEAMRDQPDEEVSHLLDPLGEDADENTSAEAIAAARKHGRDTAQYRRASGENGASACAGATSSAATLHGEPKVGMKVQLRSMVEAQNMVFPRASANDRPTQAQACFVPVTEDVVYKKPRGVISLQEQIALQQAKTLALVTRPSVRPPSVVDNSSTCTGPSTATVASSSAAFSTCSGHSVCGDGGDEACASLGVRVQRHSKFDPSQLDTDFTDIRRGASRARCKSAKAFRGAGFGRAPRECITKEGLEQSLRESHRNSFCNEVNDKVLRRTVAMHYHRGGDSPSQNTSVQDESSRERFDEQIDYRFEAGVRPDIVRLHVEAKRLEGCGGQFRDAQVIFEEYEVSVCVVDRGGKSWKFRSRPLPGTIVIEECCFQVDKTGEELCITLKKADSTEHWEKDHIIFSN
eukprot:CAMPEP_0117512796 /NCGR_PEP_ID=MMETSP0784-20121206/29218_1 /TAXON_ID=39447 /ORGANISM="" /LENGTH=498 /DNA_ID=CAMNT_0005308531 /DNA_START=92 /DNA_END=1588 /DNA_ORIENTATION=+